MLLKKIGTISLITLFTNISLIGLSYSASKAPEKKTTNMAVYIDDLVAGKVELKTHIVAKGENYKTIAKKYNINAKKLMDMNGVKSPYTNVGKKVIISRYTSPSNKFDGIIVNIPEQKLYYFVNSQLKKEYVVSVGKQGRWQTPLGTYKITNKDEAPVWKVPLSIQKKMAAQGKPVKTEVKSGPDNPLGNWWLGLNKHELGIHSTNAPASIGYSVTHGCIRMTPSSAGELFKQVKVGTPVKIVYQQVKLSFDDNKKAYLEIHEDSYNKKLNTEQLAKEILKKYKVNLATIDMKKVHKVVKLKDGVPTLISKD